MSAVNGHAEVIKALVGAGVLEDHTGNIGWPALLNTGMQRPSRRWWWQGLRARMYM